MGQRKKLLHGNPLHGWLSLDKPEGLTSSQATSEVRRIIGVDKIGHGGTLDPIATGVLPLALGQATKTTSLIMNSSKEYWFRVRWGEQRTTDDRQGDILIRSDIRPNHEQICAALPSMVGNITQVPPRFSAIKINGQRAYALARKGQSFTIAARQVSIEKFVLVGMPDKDHADFQVVCSKGTYMRALARDLAWHLGTVGHIVALQRHRVGYFTLDQALSLDNLAQHMRKKTLEKLLVRITNTTDDNMTKTGYRAITYPT